MDSEGRVGEGWDSFIRSLRLSSMRVAQASRTMKSGSSRSDSWGLPKARKDYFRGRAR